MQYQRQLQLGAEIHLWYKKKSSNLFNQNIIQNVHYFGEGYFRTFDVGIIIWVIFI